MKKVLVLVCVLLTIALASCGSQTGKMYSIEDLMEAEHEGYLRGYDEGAYYAKGGLVSEEKVNAAYDAGYDRGYEDGYYDCLEEHGLSESGHGSGRIEKGK